MLGGLLEGLKNLILQKKESVSDDDEEQYSVYDLERLLWDKDTPCTCDLCQPALYGRWICLYSHQKLNFHKVLDVSKCGHISFQPL